MAFRRDLSFGHSRQVRPPVVLGTVGNSGQAIRGSSVTDAPAMSGMRVRERTRGGATRDTNIGNREG